MTEKPASQRGSDYAILARQVRQAGLLDHRPRYYAWRIALTATALVLGWAAFAIVGNSWLQLGVAVFLAAAFAQTGFLGHDAAHSQVFRSRRANQDDDHPRLHQPSGRRRARMRVAPGPVKPS